MAWVATSQACSRSLLGAQECQQLGITGVDISHELQQLPQQLPEVMMAAVRDKVRADAVQQALQHYSAFSAEAHAASSTSGREQQQQQQLEHSVLPALAAVLSLDEADLHLREPDQAAVGSSSAHPPGQQPQLSQTEPMNSQPAEPAGSGTVATADAGETSIDWDVDLSLDADPSAEGDTGDMAAGPPAIDIDWDIDVSAAGVQSSPDDASAPAAHAGGATSDNGRAPAWLAKLLDSADARNALMDDLYELVVRPAQHAGLPRLCCALHAHGRQILKSLQCSIGCQSSSLLCFLPCR